MTITTSSTGARIVNIWGADHHGYISRMNAVMRMWSRPDLEIIMTQMVNLEVEVDGKLETFIGSKREGQYLLLKNDFVDKVGKDAARWYFLMDSPSNHLTINVNKAAQQSTSNPVYYVQYAHARLCSLMKKSADLGVSIDSGYVDLPRLGSSAIATELILKLDGYNGMCQKAAQLSSPQTVKTYLYELAQIVQKYYETEKLIHQDTEVWLAGLYLVTMSARVLKDGLGLLGISAPEFMALKGEAE